MNDLTFGEKYRDAFWRVALIPLLVGVDVAGVISRRASPVGLVALVMVGVVGLLVELVIWQDLRRTWAQGLSRGSVGSLGDRAAFLVLYSAFFWGASTYKAHRTEGMSWGDAALFALVLVAASAALVALVAGLTHRLGSHD